MVSNINFYFIFTVFFSVLLAFLSWFLYVSICRGFFFLIYFFNSITLQMFGFLHKFLANFMSKFRILLVIRFKIDIFYSLFLMDGWVDWLIPIRRNSVFWYPSLRNAHNRWNINSIHPGFLTRCDPFGVTGGRPQPNLAAVRWRRGHTLDMSPACHR